MKVFDFHAELCSNLWRFSCGLSHRAPAECVTEPASWDLGRKQETFCLVRVIVDMAYPSGELFL